MAKNPTSKTVEALKHEEAKRENIPTAEYQSILQKNEQDPVRAALRQGSSAITRDTSSPLPPGEGLGVRESSSQRMKVHHFLF